MIVIFAPTYDNDDDDDAVAAARCSHWVAQRNHERLDVELGLPLMMLNGEQAHRAALEQALGDPTRGLAFFGHGSEHRLLDQGDAAALDRDNVHLVRGRWVHAFACRAGVELAGYAAAAGSSCFVGYESALIQEWDPDHIPQEIRSAFIQLITQTTLELARGICHADLLRGGALVDAQEIVIAWCDEHPGDAPGLEILAHQLVARLVVRTSELG